MAIEFICEYCKGVLDDWDSYSYHLRWECEKFSMEKHANYDYDFFE